MQNTSANPNKKDVHSQQKEMRRKDCRLIGESTLDILLPEKNDKNHYQQSLKFEKHRLGTRHLQVLIDKLQNELIGYQDCSPISYEDAERELATSISQLLRSSSEQTPCIEEILTLLRLYKVFQLDRNQNTVVSLHCIYTILQDNFPSSFLCKFLNITIGEYFDLRSRTITF